MTYSSITVYMYARGGQGLNRKNSAVKCIFTELTTEMLAFMRWSGIPGC